MRVGPPTTIVQRTVRTRLYPRPARCCARASGNCCRREQPKCTEIARSVPTCIHVVGRPQRMHERGWLSRKPARARPGPLASDVSPWHTFLRRSAPAKQPRPWARVGERRNARKPAQPRPTFTCVVSAADADRAVSPTRPASRASIPTETFPCQEPHPCTRQEPSCRHLMCAARNLFGLQPTSGCPRDRSVPTSLRGLSGKLWSTALGVLGKETTLQMCQPARLSSRPVDRQVTLMRHMLVVQHALPR